MDDDQYFSKYDAFLLETLEQHHVPGASIAIVDGDSTWVKGYGIARYPDVKVTSGTLFNAASMTKAFVAASVSLLVDDLSFPDVQWTTPVSKLLPDDFVLSDARYTEAVTIEDILSHRSGLPDHDDACMGIDAKTPDTVESVTRKLRHLPLSAPLRSKFQYCNMMFAVGVHLIEKLTCTRMVDWLRNRIWTPLKMNSTYFLMDDIIEHKVIDQLAKGYGWDKEEETIFEIPWPVQPEGAGAGEINSTAADYASFLRCMIDKSAPFSAAGHEELVKPRTIMGTEPNPSWSPTLYALGWNIETYHGEKIIGHSGGTSGFECQMMFLPGKKWGVVIFTNSIDASPAIEKICWTLIDDLLKIPRERRFDWDEEAAKNSREYEEGDMTTEKLYPKIPEPRFPATLPLEAYAGEYADEGYGTLKVEWKNQKLFIDCMDRTWRHVMTFEHVSGEFFALEKRDVDQRWKDKLRAEFRLNAEGTVSQLGVDLVSELDGAMIWFQRIVSDEKKDVSAA
ncbi:MAG: hypothetical protein M1818_003558 [Claussenomyces sp. TS43310]|nr:MAG: hypothetical protein M1818_003558 [Claussenomyces sp. TS43310]